MIKLICGEKGTGKTKIIVDSVNEAAKTAKGNVVFISQKKSYSANIDFNVRCVYTEDFSISGVAGFIGFIDGLMAGNADIEYIYIDGILRITDTDVNGLEGFIAEAKKLEKEYGVKFILTVSCSKEGLPAYLSELCD
ncbi:MAG: ATP-binding protein [Clostridia bacterium]|nr:ATP-binding protein [Clostridia bacterium]